MTTSDQERHTRNHATIGDALIFMTKAALVVAVLVVGAFAWIAWNDHETRMLRTRLAEVETTVVTQRKHLETLARWIRDNRDALKEHGLTDEELLRQLEPTVPSLPPGFVLDQPNKFEAELRRRGLE